MKPEDPVDKLTESVSDGGSVDWSRAESIAGDPDTRASVRALRDLERIAEYHRRLQRSPHASGPSVSSPATSAPRSAGSPEQWGHLTLLEPVSSGASGEVWRAWDAWLHREVALKFLLNLSGLDPSATQESALLEESRALARVRHPGVVAVYGIAEHDGRVGMWMELLRGATLGAEIERRGALPVSEVTQIGVELCRALQAVEASGLIHRDIKPENIVLESNGRVVLTDFGLGKRRALAHPEAWGASGTPLFMAPEVLAGEPSSPRSDLYALGVTLRWALTGRCPFKAQTLEDLKLEAASGPTTSIATERPDATPQLVEAIERAMAPQPENRWRTAAQLLAALEATEMEAATPPRPNSPVFGRVAVIVAAALTGLGIWVGSHYLAETNSNPPVRLSVTPPPNMTLIANLQTMSVSPDGRMLVFMAVDSLGHERLWLRPLASLVAHPLEGTESSFAPFWSPNSRQVAFFGGMKIKKTSILGGKPEILCDAQDPRGGTWGKNNDIVFAPVATGSLFRISAEGGAVSEIQRPDSTLHETALRWPQFLPDGEHFLFVSLPPRDGLFEVYVASLHSPGRKRVMSAGSAPICAGEEGLILTLNGRLMVQKFDYRRLVPVGSPVALGPATSSDMSVGQPLAAASMNGVLIQPAENLANTELVWLDRKGKRLGVVPAPPGRYEKLYFAPDGRRILAERRDSPTTLDLWLIEVESGQARRFSMGSQTRLGGRPVFSPDGTRIAFSSNRAGTTSIYQRSADGAGEEERLFGSTGQFNEADAWSPDGRYLVFQRADPVSQWDLWLLPLDGKREPIPYLRTRFAETSSCISPDGKWLSYTTDAPGTVQLYVRSFPTPGAEILASTASGQGIWTKRGDELLVQRTGDGTVWSVPVTTEPTFKAGTPRLLFRTGPEVLWISSTPEGDRFLVATPSGKVEPTTISVDLNWPAQIAR